MKNTLPERCTEAASDWRMRCRGSDTKTRPTAPTMRASARVAPPVPGLTSSAVAPSPTSCV